MQQRIEHRASVHDTWYRVSGEALGEYMADGMQLTWEEWEVARLTRCGVWLKCRTWSHKKERFSLVVGGRFAHPTQLGAIDQLIARKRRHLAILASQKEEAEQTLELARAARVEISGEPATAGPRQHGEELV